MQQIGFLLKNLMFAQHVSGTIMHIIRSSRVIQMKALQKRLRTCRKTDYSPVVHLLQV